MDSNNLGMKFYTEAYFKEVYRRKIFKQFLAIYYHSIEMCIKNPLVKVVYSESNGIYLVAAKDISRQTKIQEGWVDIELGKTDSIYLTELLIRFSQINLDESVTFYTGVPVLLHKSFSANTIYEDDCVVASKDIKKDDILSIGTVHQISTNIKPKNPVFKSFLKFRSDIIDKYSIENRYFTRNFISKDKLFATPLEILEDTFKRRKDNYERDKRLLERQRDQAKKVYDSFKDRLAKLKDQFKIDEDNFKKDKERIKDQNSNN